MATKNRYNLTLKKQAFADLYRSSEDDAVRGNAKQCYLLIYNCKEETAESSGPRLLKDKHVAFYLEEKSKEAELKADISEERILREVARMAFLDPGQLYDDDGKLLAIQDIPEDARRCLVGLEQGVIGGVITTKVKYSDKRGPLELLMKYKKMLTDKVEHEVKSGGVLLVPANQTIEEWQAKNYDNKSPKS